MPGTALWVDGFICLPVSPFICLPLSPRLDGWHGSLGGRVHLSPCVSLHLSPVVSPPGCLARLSGWTGSFVSLCFPSFVSRCLPAWMPGTALWVDGFICLPVSPFICLPLSPRLDASFVSRCLPAWMPGTALWVDGFICLPASPGTALWVFICLPLSPRRMPGTALWVDGFICLPVSPFICLPLSPRLDAGTALWVDAFVCLPVSPFICLPLSPRLDAWHGAFVCLPGFTCLPLSPFICLPLSPSLDDPVWVDVHLSPFVICLPLSPSLDAWHGSLGWRGSLSPFVSLHLSPSLDVWCGSGLCLPSFVSRCLPAWMPGWTHSLLSLCLPSFVARCLPAWIWHGSLGGRVHVSPFVPFICLPFSTWMPGTALWVNGFICLPLSPFICLPLSPSLDAWRGSLGGRTGSFVYLCLPSFVSRCLPAWMPGTALWVDGFICLPLSPFVCLPLSPSLDAPLGGRIQLSPVVSQPGCLALTLRGFLHFPRFCPFGGVWFAFGFGPGFGHSLSCGCWGQGPLSALHLDFDFAWARGGSSSLSIVGYTLSVISALSVISVPRYQLRSRADDSGAWALFPSICLPLSPSLDVWHGSPGGQIHLSPFVSLHLSPVVSQPGCLARFLGGQFHLSPFVSLHLAPLVSLNVCHGSPGGRIHLSPFICLPSLWVDGLICLPLSPFTCLPLSPSRWTDSFVSLCLPLFVSRCLPAWMPLWVDAFICLPPGCVALTLRGFLHFQRFCPFGGVWFDFGFGPGFGHSLSCGCWGQGPLSALHLDFDFAWARGGSSSLSIVGYTLSVRSVPRYQLRPLSVLARIWSPELTRAVRCGARLQLREVSDAAVKSSIDSLMMFNEPTPRYPVVLLAPGVVPAFLGGRVPLPSFA